MGSQLDQAERTVESEPKLTVYTVGSQLDQAERTVVSELNRPHIQWGLNLILSLHIVPGSHGSHGSQKRSSRRVFSHFCLCVQVLLSLATFSHGLSREACYRLSRTVLRFLSACQVSVGTSHILLRCDQVLLRLSSSVKVFYDET